MADAVSTLRAGPAPAADSPYWNPAIETMDPEAMRELQWRRLQRQLTYLWDASPPYRERLAAAGAAPGEVDTWEQFQRIPVLRKDDLRAAQARSVRDHGDPFGGFTCAPRDRIVRINATSGTTGAPTLYALTASDVAVVNEMHARKYWRAGVRPGDVMVQALSLSMFTGGLPLSQGIMRLGAAVAPVGAEGGSRRVLEYLRLLAAPALIATPGLGEVLIRTCPEVLGVPLRELPLRKFFAAGEPGGSIPEVRAHLAEGFGAEVYDHTGGGHAFHGITCAAQDGMHFVSPDHCLLELVEPGTDRPVELRDGARGELVVTFLAWEGVPFLRTSFGDVIQVRTSRCGCGAAGLRFRIAGRADDMLIVKGVNVFPGAIRNVVAGFGPELTGRFRILLDRPGPRVEGALQLRVELGPGVDPAVRPGLERALRERMRAALRVNPEVQWVGPGGIPEAEHKERWIEVRGDGDAG
jgi:phenylacetate-CoA ligase